MYPIDIMSRDRACQYLTALESSERLQGGDLVKGRNFKPHLLFKWADELVRDPVILDAWAG